MQKVIKALISLGLSEKEAKIYLTLYKVGQATAYEIAKEAGMKRPTVYVLIEELRKKGLALVVPHKKNQIYIARDPHEFISEHQDKMHKNTRELLTSLPKMSHPVEGTKMVIFKGQGSLTQGLSYGLNRVKEKCIYAFYAGIGKDMIVRDEYFEHSENIYRLGITVKCIMPSDTHDEVFRKHDERYKIEIQKVDHALFSPRVSIEVCDDIVKTIFHKQKQVTVIEDVGLANFYKQIFNMLWKIKF